ncbi:Pheromone-regulated membrane protein 10 [Hypsizygus marmoreus]|uniref:Pheromone-regulated membrane protein 10 n=1 Tax=Hypsizygus marmoreus TaxID=39966 RepID=A0A369JQH4_HYPMA|nr:Pheromone-regulated membrane protein 10 [Hypsizygus marmoreus]
MPITIRRATEADAPALSRICLLTAQAGTSAEHLHDFGELPGLAYAVPYVKLPTTWGFVMEDDLTKEVVGYIVGSKDTRAYEAYAAEHWWPALVEKYPTSLAKKPGDVHYMKLFRKMHTAPEANIAFAAAHLHIDILEPYQRQGWGRKLITTAIEYLKEENIVGDGVWLGMDPRNEAARKFYLRLGFKNIEGADENQLDLSPTDTGEPRLPSAPRSVLSYAPRRGSHAHFADSRPTQNPFFNPAVLSHSTPDPQYPSEPQWQIPVYDNNQPPSTSDESPEEFPSRRVSQIPLAPAPADTRRGSGDSDVTQVGPNDEEKEDPYKKYSLSSYEHPYDIRPPQDAYPGPGTSALQPRPKRSAMRRGVSFSEEQPSVREYVPGESIDPKSERESKRRGLPSNMLDLYSLNAAGSYPDRKGRIGMRRDPSEADSEDDAFTSARYNRRRADSMASMASLGSEILDPDDPRVTGVEAKYLEDPEDVEKNALRQMDYRARRKHLTRIKIEFNVTSMINRQEFLIKLAKALMTFGAPSHRIESQLVAAARILEVEAEFIHLPSVIICSFGDQELGCSETHFVKCGGRLALGLLHKVHLVYRSVVHDEISAKRATTELEDLLKSPPLYPILFRCLLAFSLSALICPLAFGGSFLDMWIAGAGAFILAVLQLNVVTKSAMYANVFEITIAILVSFAARGLSSIRSQIFCYTAISSAGIIGILPGYLILSSSLELASKNIVCGSVKMVYALIYTLFLGFGLQIGSDFYLLLDRQTRRHLDDLAASLATTVALTGSWVADNGTESNDSIPLVGTWTFTHALPPNDHDILNGCYRPKSRPWYLQAFPFWTSFIIVPVFSTLSSLANLQPLRSKQLPIMVIISCCSYASNKIANHYIFNRSDVVSAIGAFTVGLLGNIYSRKMGGTAFTSMVTGVLFLVPSGLSQAGGITANGNGIDIGGAMIAVTIGITVGLFMSQALVYAFGSRKNAAVFSF